MDPIETAQRTYIEALGHGFSDAAARAQAIARYRSVSSKKISSELMGALNDIKQISEVRRRAQAEGENDQTAWVRAIAYLLHYSPWLDLTDAARLVNRVTDGQPHGEHTPHVGELFPLVNLA